MDQYLFDYLLSGKAWLLIGSGPSTEMGYPSWEHLAAISIDAVKTECVKVDPNHMQDLLTKGNYPKVFSEAKKCLGDARLRQILADNLKPTKDSSIYKLIAQWPVDVYMTTNFDDEIQRHLANLGLAYIKYSNSEDHLSQLVPDFSGAIMKLHGDLTEEKGLVLSEEDYQQISESKKWEYWRSKMAAVFQMNRVIVIGHSLSDVNIKHVLEAAKKGARVVRPVIWIAPNVSASRRNELLNNYRIRVLSYDNHDGKHTNLVRLLESINNCVPPRTIIKIKNDVERGSPPLQQNVAATGFFVFNEFCKTQNFDDKRRDIVISAIEASLPELQKTQKFSFEFALSLAGWPTSDKVAPDFLASLKSRAIELNLLTCESNEFTVNNTAVEAVLKKSVGFNHLRERFKATLVLRLKKDFSDLEVGQISRLSDDIESSLILYLRDGGLSLASVLFSTGKQRTVPASILTFIIAASTRYDNLTMRQAFFKASIDTFLHAEAAELEYLGRLSQGFFAFHGLGVFGDLAKERLNMAAETVWLIDSDTLIRLLALGCYGNSMFMDSIRRLKKLRLRFFTTTSLMQEAKTHLWFAQMVITSKGPGSLDVMESAYGQAPYRKPNLFMEGFINWQAAGNPCNWRDYIYAIFQKHEYADIDYEQTLNRLGIEVVELNVWPGFIENHYGEVQEYSNQIVAKMSSVYLEDSNETDEVLDAYRKAKPEAEAYNIITKERAGVYYINAEKGKKHEAWFLSHTSMLNLLEKNTLITWQPQAFLGYASTLCDSTSADSTKESFERIVLSLAQSGMNLLDNDTIARVFGGVIEQAGLDIQSLRDEYKEILEKKYGESIDSVLARIPPPYFPLAVTQLAAEVAQGEADKRRAVEKTSVSKDIQIEELKRRLRPLEKYQNRMLKNQNKKKKRK